MGGTNSELNCRRCFSSISTQKTKGHLKDKNKLIRFLQVVIYRNSNQEKIKRDREGRVSCQLSFLGLFVFGGEEGGWKVVYKEIKTELKLIR